ncbi:MAG: hypothetical protein SPL80_07735 [Bacilli bacterium]|nr:hypothetical protein [Bacilli bacterium]
MKRNRTEKRVFEAADALTPEPPSFERVTKGVDWVTVAQNGLPSPRRRRILVPTAIAGLAACVAAAVIIPLAVRFADRKNYYGDGGQRPVLYGAFAASQWVCSDPSIDFSLSALEVTEERNDAPSTALLFGKEGDYVCCVRFTENPFGSFEFGVLSFEMGEYRGEASYLSQKTPFSISFPLEESSEKTITISFGDSSSFAYGIVYYAPIG